MKKRIVKIALGQFASIHGETQQNLNKMLTMTDQAAESGADLIVFPELAYSGYFCTSYQMQQCAEKQDGPFVQALREKAKDKSIHIIAGYPEAGDITGRLYNSCIFIDDDGNVIENMRKVYAWGKEKLVFAEGKRYPVVKTKFGNVGMLICYDIEYPEPSRIETLKGAEIIVDCSVWSVPAERRWHVDLAGNALFNLLYVVGCNTIGENLCGSSMIVGPDGEIRAIVLGMGVPTTANYIIQATISAPALVALGVPKLAAHMFVFYFGIVADITPPVALAAFAGSGIAGSNPMKTGFTATRLGIAAYIVPYMFVLNPILVLVNVNNLSTGVFVLMAIKAVVTAFIGMVGLASGSSGFFKAPCNLLERIVLIASGLLLIDPGTLTDIAGIGIILLIYFIQKAREKRTAVTG